MQALYAGSPRQSSSRLNISSCSRIRRVSAPYASSPSHPGSRSVNLKHLAHITSQTSSPSLVAREWGIHQQQSASKEPAQESDNKSPGDQNSDAFIVAWTHLILGGNLRDLEGHLAKGHLTCVTLDGTGAGSVALQAFAHAFYNFGASSVDKIVITGGSSSSAKLVETGLWLAVLLKACPGLKHLEFLYVHIVGDHLWAALDGCPALQTLILGAGCTVDGAAIESACTLRTTAPRLDYLALSASKKLCGSSPTMYAPLSVLSREAWQHDGISSLEVMTFGSSDVAAPPAGLRKMSRLASLVMDQYILEWQEAASQISSTISYKIITSNPASSSSDDAASSAVSEFKPINLMERLGSCKGGDCIEEEQQQASPISDLVAATSGSGSGSDGADGNDAGSSTPVSKEVGSQAAGSSQPASLTEKMASKGQPGQGVQGLGVHRTLVLTPAASSSGSTSGRRINILGQACLTLLKAAFMADGAFELRMRGCSDKLVPLKAEVGLLGMLGVVAGALACCWEAAVRAIAFVILAIFMAMVELGIVS